MLGVVLWHIFLFKGLGARIKGLGVKGLRG